MDTADKWETFILVIAIICGVLWAYDKIRSMGEPTLEDRVIALEQAWTNQNHSAK